VSRARKRRPPIRSLPIALVLCLLWGTAVLSQGAVLQQGMWVFAAGTVGGAVLVVAGVVAAFAPRRRGVAVLSGLAAGVLGGVALLVLTGRGEQWLADPASALEQIRIEVFGSIAPVAVDGFLADAVVAVIGACTFLSLVIALLARVPVVAGLLPTAALLLPAAVTGSSVGLGPFVVAGLLLALLAWLGSPRLGWGGPIAAVAAVAVAAAAFLALPQSRDRVWNSELVMSPISSTVPDVTVSLAEDLLQHNQVAAFSFRSSIDGPVRFTLATLGDFEGGVWQPQTEPLDPRRTVAQGVSATGVAPEPAAADAEVPDGTVEVGMQGLVSEWLPLPQATTQEIVRSDSDFDSSDWAWSAEAATAHADDAVTRPEMSYETRFRPLTAEYPASLGAFINSAETYDDPGDAPADLRPYLELPGEMPDAIAQAASTATAGSSTSRFGTAFALQSWLRSADFVYSEQAPYEPGTDPDDPYAVMESFLAEREGFCVHYASTFAVMARSLGVPTRLNVGYAATAITDSTVTVRGDDLHVWPEVYFEDAGWVAFEPTPGVGTDRTEEAENPTEPTAAPTTASSSPSASSDEPEPTESSSAPTDAAGDGAGPDEGFPAAAWLAGAGWVLLAAAVLLVPALVRRVRRRRRIAASELTGGPRSGGRPATSAWREVRDTALDLGLLASGAPPRARTDDALLEALADRGVLAGAGLDAARAILAAANAERFGSGASAAQLADIAERRALREAIGALNESAPGRARLVAALAPRSLIGGR